MSDRIYDAIIVGAGVTGAIVARRLAERGKRVLILEAGTGAGLERGGFQTFVDRYYRHNIKSPTDPYPQSANAPVEAPFSPYYQQTGPQNFGSNYTRAAGGTTLHWMGTCLRFLPEDFRLKSLYGHGADWPIGYEDLQPYYRMAEWELGVAADTEEQERVDKDEDVFADDYEFPMTHVPESYLDTLLKQYFKGRTVKVAGKMVPIHVSRTPAARNSTPRRSTPQRDLIDPRYGRKLDDYYRPLGAPDLPDERGQRCQGNSSCIPICPVQAKYSALKSLRQAIDNSNGRVAVCTQAVASQIEIDSASGRVTGIRYKKYYDPTTDVFTEHVVRAKVYVVAAHAIETAKLLLASRAANSSNMVGRHLMDHPLLLTWGLMPKRAGAYRGPGSTSGIPLMRDGEFRKQFAACRIEIGNWGVDFPNGTPHSTIRSLVDRKRFNQENAIRINGRTVVRHPESIRQQEQKNDLFGTNLRSVIADICSRQFRFAFELEQLPDPSNRITIDQRHRDAIGNYRPVISYRLDDYCRKGMAEAKKVSNQFFKLLGRDGVDETSYEPGNPTAAGHFYYGDERYEYHGAGHLCGTHRMGSSPRDSVVNTDQRTWDHDNLFLVGCGNFCTVGTANPTLTAAALAFRASESILKELT